jgi:2,4-dienoyl-CoA reductase-like NADH-dependent reductase (Old Yellow Enzyme family)/NADPH-dependent 2,4-dienoyl-CoA reductase/sulfur reductase-like enzyme
MSPRKYPHLFTPLKVGSLTFKNRIEAAPTSLPELSPDGYLTRENIAYYRLKARGGAAVVTIGESIVHTPTGKSHPKQIPLDDKGVIPSLVEAADAIHQYGAIASIELSHGGMQCDPVFLGGRRPIGPSAMSVDIGFRTAGTITVKVEEMSEALMEEIAAAYGEAAATVKLAGFDMCMIHAAHGWLLAQFLSPIINRRTDKFGGSVENRARFPLTVIDRVRERVGKDFPIELRMGGSELAEGGHTIDDAVAFAKLAESKVDLLHVSAGAHYFIDTLIVTHPSMFVPHGCNVYLAEAVKKAVSIPVVTVGGLSDPAQMEQIIADGQADMVAVARGLLADPYLPKKAQHGRGDDVVPCLRCFDCLGGVFATATLKCAVNPIIGREFEGSFPAPPSAAKKVLVVGGGPAGMQAAITAAERGHDVMLCEMSDSLGGALKHAEGVAFKQGLEQFRRYLIRKIVSMPIGVILNMEVTPESVEVASPDVLIASVGAEPIVPSIPGVDKASVILAAAVHSGEAQIGPRVVVIGGGLVGCETGLHLAQQGRDVTIVEMLDEVASDSNLMHRRALMLELAKAVKIRTGLTCIEITSEGVVAAGVDGERTVLPADTVVVAVGYRPRTEVVDALAGTAPEFMTIGDCVRPRRVLYAVRMGYDAGMAV